MADRETIVDLQHSDSEDSIRKALHGALCGTTEAKPSWEALRDALTESPEPRAVALVGLRHAEQACPAAVVRMMTMFADLNGGGAARFLLRAGADYEVRVQFLQGEIRKPADCSEAIVSCWLKAEDEAQADAMARSTLESQGWLLSNWQESYSVKRANYDVGTEERGFYEQALIDGEVYVYDEW